MGNNLDKPGKAKASDIAEMPDGLKELLDAPVEEGTPPAILLPAQENAAQGLLNPAQQQPQLPKTQRETELDGFIAARQGIIEKLREKNPQVSQARRKIAEMVPVIRGSGASHTMKLAAEAEHIEFSIATEAYTPKKEKELIKRLRDIRQELSKHKEIDDARKAVEAERRRLHELVSEIRFLERGLDEARKKCDAAYAEVLAERKAAYEARQKNREERRQKQYDELKHRVHEQKKREYADEIKPYMKDYDDTVSMDEIVQIEKKGKKDGKESP